MDKPVTPDVIGDIIGGAITRGTGNNVVKGDNLPSRRNPGWYDW